MHDLRLALRTLRATPVVSMIAVLSLALGIGANTAIFSIVNGLLLRPLPVIAPQQLVTISSDFAVSHGYTAGLGWNYAMWEQLQQRAHAFGGAFALMGARLNLAQSGEMQPVEGLFTSGDFFAVLGVPALLGRTFSAADDVRGGGRDGPVAVISFGLWQRRFGGVPDIIGAPLVIEGVPCTIVGVTPPQFVGLEVGRAFDVALPLNTEPLIRRDRALLNFLLIPMLRLKPGQSLGEARAMLRAMQPQIVGVMQFTPKWLNEPFTLRAAAAGTSGAVAPGLRQRYERPLLTVLTVVGLVLFVACVNIANLLLARATARGHELSVRLALGAPRWRLARQLLVESVVLAASGACLGFLFATWGSRALVSQLSTPDARVLLDLSVDWRVLAFTAAITVAAVVLFGTAPAIRSARVPIIDALKEHTVRAAAGSRRRSGETLLAGVSTNLVVTQVALSLVLVVAAGLFGRTFERLAARPLGFDSDRVLVVNVSTARTSMDRPARLSHFHHLVNAVRSVPGVGHAAGSRWTPLSGGGVLRNAAGRAVESEQRVLANVITPGWFAVYGIPVRAGRDLDDRDTATALPVVVVNDAYVRRFLSGRSPIGEIVDARTVVGVVGDAAYGGSLRDPVPPTIYVPLAQSAATQTPDAGSISLSIRPAAGSPAALAPSIAAALTAVDPNLSFTFRVMSEYVTVSLAQERVVAILSGFFAVLALLLAGLGLYGVVSYVVSLRRTEIGIRLALGAAPAGVIRLILRRVSFVVGAGILLGTAASVWLSQFVAPLLYGLQPRDPATLLSAALTLASVGALAAWVPASRASRIDPAEVLRNN
jgi:putative ABC transport system permease protein